MQIKIEAYAKKYFFKAPVNGSINIDLPLKCIMDAIISDKIVSAIKSINLQGVEIAGKVIINDRIIEL